MLCSVLLPGETRACGRQTSPTLLDPRYNGDPLTSTLETSSATVLYESIPQQSSMTACGYSACVSAGASEVSLHSEPPPVATP